MVKWWLHCVMSILLMGCFLSGGLRPSFCLGFLVGRWCFWIMPGFHRKKQLYALAAVAGVFLVFLPAYSADFNRIEWWWANLKRALPDLLSGCETVQEAVYNYFKQGNF